MAVPKLFRPLLSIIASLLLLISQNYQAAFAKGTVQALTLERETINASIVDPSKNLLRITNGADLDPSVAIKPAKTTLAKGKAVKIEGSIENGTLLIDLTKLGPANLLPKGTYILTASRGTTKLRATFEIIPPTLIIGKLKVPLPASGEKLARLKYQIASGKAPTQEATIVLHAGKDFKSIAPGSIGIKTKLTQVTETNELTGKDEVSWQGQYIQEENGQTRKEVGHKPLFVEAVFKAQNTESGNEQETSFSTPIARDKTNSKTNINNDNTLSPGSTTISKFIGAAYALNEDSNTSGSTPSKYNFDKAITGLQKQFGDIGENKPISAGYEDVKAVTQALGPSIANSIYEMYPSLSGTSGGASTTTSSTSTSGGVATTSGGFNIYAGFALDVTSIAPNLVQAPTSETSDSKKLNNYLKDPNPYIIGSTDKSQLNFTVPSDKSANIYGKIGAPLGAFKPLLSEGESPRDAALGGGIAYKLDSKSTFDELKQLKEGVKDGTITGENTKFNTLKIYPGVEANVTEVIKEAKNSGDDKFEINGLPGSIFTTGNGSDNLATKPLETTNVKVNLGQGAISAPSLSNLNFVSISQDKNKYEGESLNGLAVSNDIAVVPSSVAKRFPPGAQFASAQGFQLASDKVFSAPEEAKPSETGSSTSGSPSNSGIKSFNPTTQGQQFASAFFNTSGGNSIQNNFIKNSPATFASYFGAQIPTQLNDLITVIPPGVDQNNIGATSSLSDIIGSRGGSENQDLGALFSGGGGSSNNPFGGGKKPSGGFGTSSTSGPSGNGFGATSTSGGQGSGPTIVNTNTGGTGHDTAILPGGGGLTPIPTGGKLSTQPPQ